MLQQFNETEIKEFNQQIYGLRGVESDLIIRKDSLNSPYESNCLSTDYESLADDKQVI